MYRSEQAPPESAYVTEHHPLVAAIAKFLRPELYIELGANGGATFLLTLPYVGKGIAVDIEPYESFFANMPSNGQFVRQDTVEFLKTMDDDSVDLCFLDSSHAYEATIAEFELLTRKVRPNGVVLFHDTYPSNEAYTGPGACGRVFAVIPILKQRYADMWEFSTLPAEFGLTIARKNLGRQLLWQIPSA
jgi:predicted O-methyltransferase YrrM